MNEPIKCYRMGGFDVREYAETPSTNTLAESLSPGELHDRTVILTWRQTAGRGQVGNRWESAPERNISMTVVLKPDALPADRQFAVSMAVALGCRDWVARYAEGVTVKWPNDIYVDDRKIGGILIEHRIAGNRIGMSLCGIGVNVNQEVFLSDAPNPVSLHQLTGRTFSLQEALEELLGCLARRFDRLNDYRALEHDFLDCLYRSEGVHVWRDAAGVFRASLAGVDEYGQLRLRDEEGRERVYGFKEVTYL